MPISVALRRRCGYARIFSRLELAAAATSLAVLTARGLPAQSVELTPVAVLQIPVDFVFDQSSKWAGDSKGNIFLSGRGSAAAIASFGRSGKLLRQFGGKGAGPGELKDVSDIAVDYGDTLHVFDQDNRRVSIYGGDGKFARVVPMSKMSFGNMFLKSGAYVGFVSLSSRDTAASSLRMFRPDGTQDRELKDSPADKTRASDGLSEMRVFTRANDGNFWTTRADKLVLEKRSGADGKLLSAFEFKDHWIAKMNQNGGAMSTARILGIRQDSAGLIWISGLRRDERAKPVPVVTDRIERKSAAVNPSVADLATDWDSFVEVVDPRTNRTVTTKTFGDVYFAVRGSHMYLRVREDSSGEEIVELVQPKLVPAKR